MQNKSLSFEDDSNLRSINPNPVTLQKPDSYYLEEVNKVVCPVTDILVNDNSNIHMKKIIIIVIIMELLKN